MYQSTRHINLSVPQSWSRCSLPELRAIASVLKDRASAADRYHPFDMRDVKIAAFFLLTGIEIVEPLNPRVPVEEQYYTVRLRPYTLDQWDSRRFWCRLLRLRDRIARFFGHDDTFSLYLWQVSSWLFPPAQPGKQKEPGLLDWLDQTQGEALLIFPLRQIRRRRHRIGRSITFSGPAPLMDGFTWQRYRWAQDYIENCRNLENRYIQLVAQGSKASLADIQKARSHADMARALFLATLFERRITYVNPDTGRTETDFHYQSNQHTDNSPWFRHFPDEDWQIITLWWESTMHYLARTYPKVFKTQSVKPGRKRTNPMELYTRTTSTLEKYLGLSAQQIDREPYTTVLQQLENISREAEEMERIRNRNKRK